MSTPMDTSSGDAGTTADAASTAAAASASASAAAAAPSLPLAAASSGRYQLTPLYGSDNRSGGAICSLLRLDDLTLLLDCGWDARWDPAMLEPLRAVVGQVDGVLLTHPDVAHLGALPYAVGKLGLTAPIYATLPVWRMGQMFMYDAYQSLAENCDPPFSLDDVDRCFDAMRQLKYSETVRLSSASGGAGGVGGAAQGEVVEVTPSCAGHMLGGAFWHIRLRETESIIYAVDFNHAAERHLNGALLNAPQLHRPSALITDATNVLVSSVKRSQQDMALTTAITNRLRAGGNVLLPVDAAGRVLELLLVIHGMWSTQQLYSSYTLAFLSPQSRNSVDFARSQLEWMTDKMRKMFDSAKVNPFALPHLRMLTSLSELRTLPSQPMCLLVSNDVLEASFSQQVFADLAADPRTLLLFTTRAPQWSLAGQFFDPDVPHQLRTRMPTSVTFERSRKVKLEGDELEKFREEQSRQRAETSAEDDRETLDEMDEDDEMSLGADALSGANLLAPMRASAAARAAKQAGPQFPMFPYAEPKRSFDIFGEPLTDEELTVLSGGAAQPIGQSSSRNRAGDARADREARDRKARSSTAGDAQQADGAQEVPEDLPTRVIKETVTLPISCSVQYLDLEGRSDGRSLERVLKDVQPRKLIVLGGSTQAKETLRSRCIDNDICNDVVLPSAGESVIVTASAPLYRLHLKDSLLAHTHFVSVNDEYEVAYVDGDVQLPTAQSHAVKGLAALAPALEPRGHPAVFLGQVRPSDLQLLLQNEGIQCELVGGVLVCNDGAVNVHKISEQQMRIEGALSDDYYRIRDLLYSQYIIC